MIRAQNIRRQVVRLFVVCAALLAVTSGASGAAPSGRDDFDWEIGTWHSSVRVLADPLSGSQQWLEFEGTSVVRPLLDGRVNALEFDVSGPAGRIEALNLRLYEPGTDRWSLNFANMRDGLLTPAVRGGFQGRTGTFFGKDTLNGRPIDVRFVITRQTRDTARFEQAYSADGGKTWETNWISLDRRRK